MSMYNLMFGESPAADILLGLLGMKRDDFYRYRDCYLAETDAEVCIAVHTRGGGNNRECYCEDIGTESERTEVDSDGYLHMPGCVVLAREAAEKHSCYLSSVDDDFDNTYETTAFSVPEAGQKVIDTLKDMESVKRDPKAAWQKLFAGLEAGDREDPMVKNALEVGKKIFDAIGEAKKNTVKV